MTRRDEIEWTCRRVTRGMPPLEDIVSWLLANEGLLNGSTVVINTRLCQTCDVLGRRFGQGLLVDGRAGQGAVHFLTGRGVLHLIVGLVSRSSFRQFQFSDTIDCKRALGFQQIEIVVEPFAFLRDNDENLKQQSESVWTQSTSRQTSCAAPSLMETTV